MAIIFTVNSCFTQALQALGHTVYDVSVRHAGMYSAKLLLQKYMPGFVQPDIFFHAEALGTKIFFSDIHELSCRTAFWSIDTHLHYGWQQFYGRLYDIFFTPHKNFLTHLPASWQHPNTHRLTRKGDAYPWKEHTKRTHNLNFVGRLSGTRQQRKNLCCMLQERFGVTSKENLSFTDMMHLFADTRVIPNESIANEVNFRLMEGTSVGACVISPDVGEDQNCLFTPGKEILVYKDLEDLEQIITRCLQEPDFCESVGRAAWERVQKEHLIEHKTAQLCAAFFDQPTVYHRELAYSQDIAQFSFFLAYFSKVIQREKSSCLHSQEPDAHTQDTQGQGVPKELVPSSATCFPFYKHNYTLLPLGIVQELFLTLQAEGADNPCPAYKEKVYALLSQADYCLLQKNTEKDDALLEYNKMLAIACGGAALHYGDAARSYFYLRQHEKLCQYSPPPLFTCPMETGLSWVTVLIREKKQCLVGSNYVSGCCRTAFDFTFLLRERDVYDMRWVAGMTLLDHVWKHYPAFDEYSIPVILR